MAKNSIITKITAFFMALAVFAGTLTWLAAPVFAAEGQFEYYVECAQKGGLVPSFSGGLDEKLRASDLLDFSLQFLKIKCGVDVDSYLTRARSSNSSEASAKAAAVNEIMKKVVVNPKGNFDVTVTADDLLGQIITIACAYIAHLSPMIYYTDPESPIVRYNFLNYPMVVYHEDVAIGLMDEILTLGNAPDKSGEAEITRRQAAAYMYMFSTMSLPKDMSGKYGGGLSGNELVDGFVADILDKCIKSGMTDTQKIKAVYDYMIYNFRHNDKAMPMLMNGNYNDSANPLECTIDLAYPIIAAGEGTCDVFANLFRLLILRLGYECNYVSGQYVNRDGSKAGHGWNQVKVNDEWYWADVDVEGTVFHKSGGSAPSYFLFMKKDGEWVSNHQWERADWPAADAAKHPVDIPDEYKKFWINAKSEVPASAPANNPSAWAQTAVDKAKSAGLLTADLTNGYQTAATRAEFCRAAVNLLRKYGYDVEVVTPKSFADTSDKDIGIAAALGITGGTDTAKNLFSPNNALTREQAAAMLLNVIKTIGADYDGTAVDWTDAKDISNWAKEAADAAYNAKIMGGTSTNALVFEPKALYTHEASIATLVNLWEYVNRS